MPAPRKYPPELRERAVRMVAEQSARAQVGNFHTPAKAVGVVTPTARVEEAPASVERVEEAPARLEEALARVDRLERELVEARRQVAELRRTRADAEAPP